jgi:hypothetical protein
MSDMRIVFWAMKENHLYAKFFQMRVMVKESEFPWSCDSSGGIVVDLSKINVVLLWETLKSATEIRSFFWIDWLLHEVH